MSRLKITLMFALFLFCLKEAFAQAVNGIANQVVAPPIRSLVTIANLPTCNSSTQGQMYLVSNALTSVSLASVVSGGAIVVGVLCNGSLWIVE